MADKRHLARNIVIAALLPVAVVGVYVLSILWRVGGAEERLFGRNYLVLVESHPREYSEAATEDSFGEHTYSFVQNGQKIHVYKQLTNGFQHVFGSALAAFEVGDENADLLFRANEYAESLFAKSSGTDDFYMDTKKDLANNIVGRQIADDAHARGLEGGMKAESYMISQALAAMADGRAITHFADERVQALPSLHEFGCPFLKQIQEARRHSKLLTFDD